MALPRNVIEEDRVEVEAVEDTAKAEGIPDGDIQEQVFKGIY